MDVVTAKKGDGVVLSNVLTGGAGQKAGLSAGDELVAIDGVRVSLGNLKTVLAMYSIGDEAEISLFRRDELKHFNVTLDAPRADTCFITLNQEAHGKILARRNRWLGQDA